MITWQFITDNNAVFQMSGELKYINEMKCIVLRVNTFTANKIWDTMA